MRGAEKRGVQAYFEVTTKRRAGSRNKADGIFEAL